jgi:hypothetical protein
MNARTLPRMTSFVCRGGFRSSTNPRLAGESQISVQGADGVRHSDVDAFPGSVRDKSRVEAGIQHKPGLSIDKAGTIPGFVYEMDKIGRPPVEVEVWGQAEAQSTVRSARFAPPPGDGRFQPEFEFNDSTTGSYRQRSLRTARSSRPTGIFRGAGWSFRQRRQIDQSQNHAAAKNKCAQNRRPQRMHKIPKAVLRQETVRTLVRFQ